MRDTQALKFSSVKFSTKTGKIAGHITFQRVKALLAQRSETMKFCAWNRVHRRVSLKWLRTTECGSEIDHVACVLK